jgi:hypothetical protein
MGSALIPSKTYGTGTYLLQDSQCLGQGPILGADPSASKRFAGGVSIDLERGELGLRENLLMQLTYLPLRSGDRLPDGNTAGATDQPVLEIQLISAGVTRAQMQATEQPRYLAFFDSLSFPRIVGRLSVLAPRDGELREEQVIIPLSTDLSIDRIRIERVSGSAVLMDVSLQRLGPR